MIQPIRQNETLYLVQIWSNRNGCAQKNLRGLTCRHEDERILAEQRRVDGRKLVLAERVESKHGVKGAEHLAAVLEVSPVVVRVAAVVFVITDESHFGAGRRLLLRCRGSRLQRRFYSKAIPQSNTSYMYNNRMTAQRKRNLSLAILTHFSGRYNVWIDNALSHAQTWTTHWIEKYHRHAQVWTSSVNAGCCTHQPSL